MNLLLERIYFRLRYRDGEARAIASIRHSMRALGFPIECTDEELIASVAEAGRVMAQLGVTMEEASRAFNIARLGIPFPLTQAGRE